MKILIEQCNFCTGILVCWEIKHSQGCRRQLDKHHINTELACEAFISFLTPDSLLPWKLFHHLANAVFLPEVWNNQDVCMVGNWTWQRVVHLSCIGHTTLIPHFEPFDLMIKDFITLIKILFKKKKRVVSSLLTKASPSVISSQPSKRFLVAHWSQKTQHQLRV